MNRFPLLLGAEWVATGGAVNGQKVRVREIGRPRQLSRVTGEDSCEAEAGKWLSTTFLVKIIEKDGGMVLG